MAYGDIVVPEDPMERLSIRYDTGETNSQGKEIYRTMTLSQIKADATDQALYNVAYRLFEMSNYSVAVITKRENTGLGPID